MLRWQIINFLHILLGMELNSHIVEETYDQFLFIQRDRYGNQ